MIQLPDTLRHIRFTGMYTQPIDFRAIPEGVTHLKLEQVWDEFIPQDSLPSTLTHLSIPRWPGGHIPAHLTHLTTSALGDNLPIMTSLTSLKLGANYTRSLPSPLPFPCLTKINFGSGYNHDVPVDLLPPSVVKAIFGIRFQSSLALQQTSITHLTISSKYHQHLGKDQFPSTLKCLCINIELGMWKIRPTQAILRLVKCAFQILDGADTVFERIPKYLLADDSRRHSFHLQVKREFPLDIEQKTPTDLTLGPWFNKSIEPHSLPSNITELTYGNYYNQPLIEGCHPASLVSIKFGVDFNQFIEPNTLPPHLEMLDMGYSFNQPIEAFSLPSSLIKLKLGRMYDQPLLPNSLPPHLETLSLTALPVSHWVEHSTKPYQPTDYRLIYFN
eukprot:gene14764-17446_t